MGTQGDRSLPRPEIPQNRLRTTDHPTANLNKLAK